MAAGKGSRNSTVQNKNIIIFHNTKGKIKGFINIAFAYLNWISFALPCLLPSTTLALLIFFKHIKSVTASGLLYLLFSMPGMLFRLPHSFPHVIQAFTQKSDYLRRLLRISYLASCHTPFPYTVWVFFLASINCGYSAQCSVIT